MIKMFKVEVSQEEEEREDHWFYIKGLKEKVKIEHNFTEEEV